MDDTTEIERGHSDWPLRPWIMALVGALGGLVIHALTDGLVWGSAPDALTILRKAVAAGVLVGGLSFLLTAERKRLGWAVAFAIVWGLVVTLIGYSIGGYNRGGDLFEFPFLSGLLAVGIAAPLFQAMRDEGRRALPYDKVHFYAWTDGIIGGASLAFTMLSFALAFLLGALFDAIGISLLKTLLAKDWFGWMVAGTAFGAASAVLRERDPLLGTLRRLVMLVFSVLAPVLAFALAIYLLALPVTGLGGLWKSGLPETPLLLSAAAFSFVLLNALIGDSDDERKAGRMWRWTEIVLLVAVLPLGALALVSMSMRVSQYGWTPERIWGVLACLVAIAFGIANWLALWRGRGKFDEPVRTYQKRLAAGLCGVALFLALPILDFGAVSARSQLARLESGKVKPANFDWTSMAFDFGPSGRKALEGIRSSGGPEQRTFARTALAASDRYDVRNQVEKSATEASLADNLRVFPERTVLSGSLKDAVTGERTCRDRACVLIFVSPSKARLIGHSNYDDSMSETDFVRQKDGNWAQAPFHGNRTDANAVDPSNATIEIRPVTRRQIFLGGKPVGDPFE